ncbi:MAG: hypothetical protein NT013_30940 [Planctomycetia bacterium]|nr:hypothetical protein [Planctomycetia bacterium]
MARMIPRKRTILGGTLAVGLVAGIFLSGKLPHLGSGIGLGTGGDGLLGKPNVENVSGDVGDSAKSSDTHSGDDADKEKPPKPKRIDVAPTDEILTILVEDRHYAVWRRTRKGNGYFPAELEKLVELASKAQPNDDGIRVRILRSKSARITAWKALQTGLVEAGIPAESIVVPKDLVD